MHSARKYMSVFTKSISPYESRTRFCTPGWWAYCIHTTPWSPSSLSCPGSRADGLTPRQSRLWNSLSSGIHGQTVSAEKTKNLPVQILEMFLQDTFQENAGLETALTPFRSSDCSLCFPTRFFIYLLHSTDFLDGKRKPLTSCSPTLVLRIQDTVEC